LRWEGIDQSRQAGGLACKAGQYDASAALVHQRGERFARIARRARSFEYHFIAAGLKTFDPAHERRRTIEKCRFVNHADEGDRQAYAARMIQNPAAIVERAIDLGYRKQPRLRQIFLLHIDENDDRNAR
jgi:hypothetical protein